MMVINCKYCQKEFNAVRVSKKWCSNTCKYKFLKNQRNIKCIDCSYILGNIAAKRCIVCANKNKERNLHPKGQLTNNCKDCFTPIGKKSIRCMKCNAKIPKERTKEWNNKISISQKGKIIKPESIIKIKMSLSKLNRIVWNKGKPNLKIRGENNPNWKGGKGSIRKTLMGQIEYIEWRKSIFKRDDYTCQICGKRGQKLQADHIKAWATHPELRYELSNGRTLCVECHIKTDNYGSKALKNKLLQLINFII